MHFIYLPIFCMCIVFDFSSDHCNAEEKLELMIMQSYGDKQGAFSSKWKWWIYIYYIDTSVLLDLLENIPLVKFIKTTSGTWVVYFP